MSYKVLNIKANAQQRKIIFSLAQATGIKVHFNSGSGSGFITIPSVTAAIEEYENWEYVTLSEDGIGALHSPRGYEEGFVSYEDFILALAIPAKKVEFEIKLNDAHSAKVNVQTGKVEVGCQTFELATIRELVAKADELLKA